MGLSGAFIAAIILGAYKKFSRDPDPSNLELFFTYCNKLLTTMKEDDGGDHHHHDHSAGGANNSSHHGTGSHHGGTSSHSCMDHTLKHRASGGDWLNTDQETNASRDDETEEEQSDYRGDGGAEFERSRFQKLSK